MTKQGTIQMPPAVSTIAGEVDALYYFIFYVSVFFFILIVAGMIYFVAKHHQKGKLEKTSGIDHNTTLEVVWTVIPTIILAIIFVWGFVTFLKMSVVPKDSLEISVKGQRWFWSFDYPGGASTVNELVVPVDKKVSLLMSSADVIHSMFVPAFRVKYDVLPNRYTQLWFEATEEGEYDFYCTEYCGTQHSQMIGKVRVLSQAEYAKWLDGAGAAVEGASLADVGAKLYKSKACFTCHSLDGSRVIGPTFKGRFGQTASFKSGPSITVDENYVRESILKPQAKIVAGYDPVMPTYQGVLKDREVDALIEFIKSLKE